MTMRFNAHKVTGNANGLAAASVIPGAAVDIGDNARQKVRALSAMILVDIETNTLTMAGLWQVSNDGTTWVDVAHGPQNPAGVVIGTGTAGADAPITKAFPAPEAVYGWRKARFSLVTAGTTGAAADTYEIGYSYRNDA